MVLNKSDITNYNDNYNVLDKQLIIQYRFSNAVFNSVPYESNHSDIWNDHLLRLHYEHDNVLVNFDSVPYDSNPKFNHDILYKYDKYSTLYDRNYNRYDNFLNNANNNGNYVFFDNSDILFNNKFSV